MNTRDLEAFVAVVESGSMVRAAQKLHLTQPGLTRRMQSLETLLGVELLDRQSKPLKPTRAGDEVYTLARSALRAVDDLLAIASSDIVSTGEFRIGVPPFLSELALEKPIDRLRAAFSKLTLRVTSGWSPGLIQDVERGVLDAAVVLMPDTFSMPDTLHATSLAFRPTVVVAAHSLGLSGKPFTLAELSRYDWVLNQDGCGFRSALSRALAAAGLPFSVAVEAFGADLQLSLVVRGLGIGLVSPDKLARSPYRDELDVVDTVDFRAGLTVWFIHGSLPGRLMRPAQLLRDAIADVLAQEGIALPAG
ncbi:LysR family transcriptional regulator [Trinickia violacea]|uniref:LysR family transcriptional regulator n=1 Tax=Trinickia violacea TaxID=2571746 RepID=A0A4P8IXI5_9BURK|nr:LysR family transcriptional regulator [Trinickia violacea]QCP53221.1 LysR family transcriptional regulator [Trinickia violacea]